MGFIAIARNVRHAGTTGKTLAPTVPYGTPLVGPAGEWGGDVVQVRKKKKYARRYRVCADIGDGDPGCMWVRGDQLAHADRREPLNVGHPRLPREQQEENLESLAPSPRLPEEA